MGQRTLQILGTAYRANVEEQDDPVVWITHALKGAGADVHLLLEGNAVNYAVAEQDASGLRLGHGQKQPPHIGSDLVALVNKGVDVFLVHDDARERGVADATLVPGIKQVSRRNLPELFSEYDRIWHW